MVPVACGLFPQKCSLKSSTIAWLEPEQYKILEENAKGKIPERLYFNKGL